MGVFLIYFLNGTEPYYSFLEEVMRSVRTGERQGVLSVISELELLVRPLREGDREALRPIHLL